ncbi:MAG: hypothetical protein JWN69_1232, partial [Alphaproteobacteria bacterium]|nr:hypothetical protein [Alphaproteobacteria bacterium]
MATAQKFMSQRRTLAWPAAHLLGAMFLLWIAFANGFPMFFNDSGTYLSIGKALGYPKDRPATYGLAIAPFHLAFGLWGIVIAQALFATWVIGLVMTGATERRAPRALIGATALLAVASSLPWFVGQVMPDLFTGLMVVLIFLLVFPHRDLPRRARLLLTMLLTMLIGFHLSHLAIAAILIPVAAVAAVRWGPRRQALAGAAQAAAAWVLAVLALSTANVLVTGQFRPAVMSESFMFASLLERGLAGEVLDEACAERTLSLCAAQPLIERSKSPGSAYLWGRESPLHVLQRTAPERLRAEEAAIIRRTIAERPADVLRMAVRGWAGQLTSAASGDGMEAYPPESSIAIVMRRHFSLSGAAWAASLQ